MAHWDFPGSGPIDLYIDLAAGRIALAAEPADVTTVDLSVPGSRGEGPDVRVSFDDGRLEIVGPRRSGLRRGHSAIDLAVTVPAGSRCVLRTASADVSCKGDLGDLDVHTASGDVTAGVVTGSFDAVTASGDVRLEEAKASADVRTAGGDVRLARADSDVTVRTASGDVHIGDAAASVTVVTASGDVRVSRVAAGHTDAHTSSGDIVVGVAAGAGVYLDLSSVTGSAISGLDEAEASDDVPLEITCRTVSGEIRIIRASGSESERRRAVPAAGAPDTPPPAG